MKTKTPGEVLEEYNLRRTVELARKDKPDVRWTGRLLAQVDSDTESRDGGRKGRWSRLQLWELEGGAWLAAAIGCSDREGEVDIGDVKVITDDNIGDADDDDQSSSFLRPDASREERTMRFFGWSWLAKKLAFQLGWDVVEVIGE